jgi:uncharacterized protein (TIGR03086 family)
VPDVGEQHLAVCRRFGEAVRAADGKWGHPSPCDGWDARAVLEHVIGFHDVLLLRPLGLKPDRPREDAQVRWDLTLEGLEQAFDPARRLFERVIDIPTVGDRPASRLDAVSLVPNLTRDVLVHTWDLARAVGADDRLDPHWCEMFYDQLQANPEVLIGAGMFKPAAAVRGDADVQSRLIARLGRDPDWRPAAQQR